ncbi:MAG: hypothetical protein ACYDCK_14010 [Thermoplasmatota archaeon]
MTVSEPDNDPTTNGQTSARPTQTVATIRASRRPKNRPTPLKTSAIDKPKKIGQTSSITSPEEKNEKGDANSPRLIIVQPSESAPGNPRAPNAVKMTAITAT